LTIWRVLNWALCFGNGQLGCYSGTNTNSPLGDGACDGLH
jgi:hypothetical protein